MWMKGIPRVTRSARHVFMSAGACGWLAMVAGLGCSMLSTAPAKETLPDGSFRLKCHTPLPRCLDAAEEMCHGARYRVIAAEDNHAYTGPHGWEDETRSSEAVFRCGTRGARLWGQDDPVAGAVAAAGSAAAASNTSDTPNAAEASAPARVGPVPALPPLCVPGSTQACVGAAACQGGQFCLPAGGGFSPCDCGRGDEKDAGTGGRAGS